MSGTPSISNSPISAMPSVQPEHHLSAWCQQLSLAHALERRCSASGEIGAQKGNVSHSGEWNCITHSWGSRFSVVTTPVCRTRTISGGQWISDLPSKPQPTPSKFDKGSELYAGLVLNMLCEEWSSRTDKGGIALRVTEMNCPWKQIWKGPEDQSHSKNFPPLFFLGCVLQLGIRYAQSPVSRRHWRWSESHLAMTNDTAPMWQCTGLDLESRIQQHTRPVS